jgi:hypothetical protein
MKAVNGIDAPDVTYFVGKLPTFLAHLFESPRDAMSAAQFSIQYMLYDQLSNNFESLQEDPEKFLNGVSTAICSSFFKKYLGTEDMMSIETLRGSTIKLVDICLSKMTWDISDGPAMWNNIKTTMNNILKLQDENIVINKRDVKELLDSLIIRLCYFVDLLGASIPMEFYQAVHEDLKHEIPGLDDFEEDLESLSSLREIVQATMMDNVSKSIAKNKFGIVAKK